MLNFNLNVEIGLFDQLKIQNNGKELINKQKDEFLKLIDCQKDKEDFYIDAFNNKISFNGIKNLLKAGTKLSLTSYQVNEIKVCSNDYSYFRRNYCKIVSKKGIERPDPRPYQEELEKQLITGTDTVIHFPRQSGKCISKDSFVNISKNNIKLKVTVETLHNMDRIEYYSLNKKKQDRHFLTVERFQNLKLFKDIKFTQKQIMSLNELFELTNNLSFPFKKEWLFKFIKGSLEDNFVIRVLNLLDYNKLNIKSSGNTFEKMVLLYGYEYATANFNQRKNKFKSNSENPAFNHGGTLSAYSRKFIKYQGLNDLDINNKIEIIKNKNSFSNKTNGNNDCTLLYYKNKGFSENESKEFLSKRQGTFSLDICIKKHGIENGTSIFNKRQQKWKYSLNNKSQEEIEKISMLKSNGAMGQLFKSKPSIKNLKGILYYIRFFNDDIEFWKIGITSKEINKRFGTEEAMVSKYNLKREIIKMEHSTFYKCFKKEQMILRKNKEHRIIIKYNGFSSTECFKKDIF